MRPYLQRRSAALKWIATSIALFISLVLGVAAYGKFFFPAEKLIQLDRLTSYFELVLILFLCVFRLHYILWLWTSLVFASWGGYALYWYGLKLPCNCMGSMISVPSTYALFLDVLFFVLGLSLAFVLGASRSLLYLTVLGSLLFLFFGYVFAEWVFYEQILGMPWSLLKS